MDGPGHVLARTAERPEDEQSQAYGGCLSAFRGGPIFPSLFVGAAGGILLSRLPGLSLDAGFATGVGAMAAAMLRLPLTSVLLATLLMGKEGLTVMPLVIVAVVVAYVASYALRPAAVRQGGAEAGAEAGAGTGAGTGTGTGTGTGAGAGPGE